MKVNKLKYYKQYLRQTEKLIRQLQDMYIESMLDLKTVSRACQEIYTHWIKNCLAKMPSELLIDSRIAKATGIDKTYVRATWFLAKVLTK